jgi:hypothetical protein
MRLINLESSFRPNIARSAIESMLKGARDNKER